jgi:hypothetical protein
MNAAPRAALLFPSNRQGFAALLVSRSDGLRICRKSGVHRVTLHLKRFEERTVHVRSLALLIAIFAVSATLAGYVGKRYEPAAQHPVQSATVAAPQPVSPPAAVFAPVPARESAQPVTLQSAPDNRTTRDLAPPPKSVADTGASSRAEAPRTTGARDGAAAKCNQQACANAYRSFDASDCTWQPNDGSARRLCRR